MAGVHDGEGVGVGRWGFFTDFAGAGGFWRAWVRISIEERNFLIFGALWWMVVVVVMMDGGCG